MLLCITSTHRPTTDLGFLLAKYPDRVQSFTLGFGQADIVYPEASAERCTVTLILDLDPVALVRAVEWWTTLTASGGEGTGEEAAGLRCPQPEGLASGCAQGAGDGLPAADQWAGV